MNGLYDGRTFTGSPRTTSLRRKPSPVIYGLCDGHLGTNAARFLASQLETVPLDG